MALTKARTAPIGAVLASALLFGTTGTAQALGAKGATPLGVGAARVLIGAIGLLVVARVMRSARTGWFANRATLVVAGIGVAGYQIGFFEGTKRAGVALGTLVALGSGPVFAGGFHAILSRRWPSRGWVVATSLAGAGAGLVAIARNDQPGDSAAFGVLCALLAGLSYAVFSLASKQAMARGVDPIGAMAAAFTIGAIVLIPFVFVEPMHWLSTGRGIAMAVHLGLAATTLAYALFGFGLSHLNVPTVVTLTLAEPATAAILSVLVLSQHLAFVGWIGVALVMTGVVMVATVRSEPATGR